MTRRILQISLALTGVLMFVRFGGPALFFGTTGPGPFGNRWVAENGTPRLLLDADLRFAGALMIGIGVVFFRAIARVEAFQSVIYILASAVALGAAARIYARLAFGDPGTAGIVPIIIEVIVPIVIMLSLRQVTRTQR